MGNRSTTTAMIRRGFVHDRRQPEETMVATSRHCSPAEAGKDNIVEEKFPQQGGANRSIDQVRIVYCYRRRRRHRRHHYRPPTAPMWSSLAVVKCG